MTIKLIKPIVFVVLMASTPFLFAINGDTINAGAPVNVPDGGSTLLLLGVAIMGFAIATRKRYSK